MLKKLMCLLSAGIMLVSLCACNGGGDEKTTVSEPITEFEKYVIAKEVFANLPEGKKLSEYNGKTYTLVEYEEKQCVVTEMSRGNMQVIYEFDGGFELLDEANKRTSGSHIYFVENQGSKTQSVLKALYLPTATALTVVDALCSNFVLFDVPASYELYPYGFIADSNGINVINLKECSNSSYSKTVQDASVYFDAPDALFASGKRGSYTYTSLETVGRTHIMLKVFDVNSKGEETLAAKFTFNPLNGVFANETEK